MDILRDMNRQNGTTVIVVTHAMELVAEYTASIVAMSTGRIVLSGSAREVFRRAAESAQPVISLPPIVKLGMKLQMNPVPLTVDEFVRAQ
jgi:ABC-type glutathione transport system ATPase component